MTIRQFEIGHIALANVQGGPRGAQRRKISDNKVYISGRMLRSDLAGGVWRKIRVEIYRVREDETVDVRWC